MPELCGLVNIFRHTYMYTTHQIRGLQHTLEEVLHVKQCYLLTMLRTCRK